MAQPLLVPNWRQKWKGFDWKTYKSEFKKNDIIWAVVFVLLLTLFRAPIREIVNLSLVSPILSKVEPSFITTIVLSVTVCGLFLHLRKHLLNHLIISPGSVILNLAIASIYLILFRFDDYLFYKIPNTPIAYGDVFLLSTMLLTATYKTYFNSLADVQNSLSLIGDTASLTEYHDHYDRSGYANTLTTHILATNSTTSFAIGVIGEWGAGKTDFLLRIKKQLDNHTDIIAFEFNPWRVKTDSIIDEFFKTLAEKLRPYNQTLTTKIRDYSKRILQTGKEAHFKLIDTLLNEWLEHTTIQEQYEDINKSIKLTGKKVAVIIDDIDRLTGKEVMEVLRLIRNTANFSGTFFITGIDQKYIVNVLKNTKDFANEEEYLRKVFQLTITLPAFKKEILIPKAKELLLTNDLNETDKKRIDDAISKTSFNLTDSFTTLFPAIPKEELFERLIENIRDLKRLCNSFKIAFNILKDETDIHDLFVLELIRNKNIEVYNAVRNRKVIGFDSEHSSEFILDLNKWNELVDKIDITEKDKAALKDAVLFLVRDEKYKNARKFKLVFNFYLYFSYQLFQLISFKEFNDTIKQKADDIAKKFSQWIGELKEPELLNIVEQVSEFREPEMLAEISRAYIKLSAKNKIWLIQAQKLLFTSRGTNHKLYFSENTDAHKNFFLSLLNDKSLDVVSRASIASLFLEPYATNRVSGVDRNIMTKKEWQKIMYWLFDEYLSIATELNLETLQFFYKNDDNRDPNNFVILYLPAVRRLRRFLEDPEHFKEYIRYFIRPLGQPYDGRIAYEPYVQEIFGNWNNFETRLNAATFSEPGLQRLQSIIPKYRNSFVHLKYGSIKIIDTTDSEFVDAWLVKHGLLR